MGKQSVSTATEMKVKSVSFIRDISVLNLGTIAKVADTMVDISTVPEFNGFVLKSKDDRYRKELRVPMYNVAAYLLEESGGD